MAVFWVYFPWEWIRKHWMRQWDVQPGPVVVLEIETDEPIRILHLSSGRTAPSSSTVALRGRAVEPEVEEEEPEEVEPPKAEGTVDFSYDPFSTGIATSELLLQPPDPATLNEAALLRSLSLAGDLAAAGVDSNDIAWLAMRFGNMQHDFILERRNQWSAEARAIWMERHELWKKLYGDDEEWP